MTDYLVEVASSHIIATPIDFPNANILSMSKGDAWEHYFDRSRFGIGIGVGVILVPPSKKPLPLSYKLTIQCTNYIVECESLISGFSLIPSNQALEFFL